MRKNIVILADGTARDGDGTNISRLHYIVEDRIEEQLVLYLPGVGTERRRFAGNVGGMGISDYLLECYRFINDHFMVGDKIFLFGFSRGATTVVSLARFIHYFGLLPRRPGAVETAFRIYSKVRDPVRLDRAIQEITAQKFSMWVQIDFLGLFDAVGALGLPNSAFDGLLDYLLPHRFHIGQLDCAASVANVYHAIAIDEERAWFSPLLWDVVDDERQGHQRVWFCGSHSDIGGGYAEHELSDIPLTWMVQKATAHGLRVQPGHRVALNPEPNGYLHDSRGGVWSRFYPKKERSWDSNFRGRPTIHASVLERTRSRQNQEHPRYAPWILGDSEYDVEPWG